MKKYLKISIVILIILGILVGGYFVTKYFINKYNRNHVIAKWTFKENENSAVTQNIHLKDTTKTKIEKGNTGKFDLLINGEGSQTELTYVMVFSNFVNKPAGLKFYSDKECTKELIGSDSFVITGTLDKEQIKKDFIKTVYWKWQDESSENNEENSENSLQKINAEELDFDATIIVMSNPNAMKDENSNSENDINNENITNQE